MASPPKKRRSAKPVGMRQVAIQWGVAGLVAGVDEAGRGPLAGPVMAAAVILDDLNPIKGLADSKKLSPKKRELLFDEIRAATSCQRWPCKLKPLCGEMLWLPPSRLRRFWPRSRGIAGVWRSTGNTPPMALASTKDTVQQRT